jgi:hypothetical protein
MAPVSSNVIPSRAATNRAVELFPDPAGPSMAMIIAIPVRLIQKERNFSQILLKIVDNNNISQ